ncbi:hypothetical protein BDZ85DRAFT_125707 [Elsinoe ampelina]|uniref:Uncharacterized protein n=1 Tax=Elsinoe ampelina TaxID=302913 RepID=A0A6A6G9K0_9PEZI|nr:hypothetical protein BDZ85DRAFT_125707 [Elsinoe ampelina]
MHDRLHMPFAVSGKVAADKLSHQQQEEKRKSSLTRGRSCSTGSVLHDLCRCMLMFGLCDFFDVQTTSPACDAFRNVYPQLSSDIEPRVYDKLDQLDKLSPSHASTELNRHITSSSGQSLVLQPVAPSPQVGPSPGRHLTQINISAITYYQVRAFTFTTCTRAIATDPYRTSARDCTSPTTSYTATSS